MECVRPLFTCAYEHTHTHTLWGAFVAAWVGWGQQGDLRKGEQLCFGSDVPFGCGSSRGLKKQAPVWATIMCLAASLEMHIEEVLPVRLKVT